MNDGASYGHWLKRRRGRRGEPGFVSQEELGDRVGVQRTYINQIENGRVGVPEPPLRQRIHAALGTTEEELIALGIVQGLGARLAPVQAVTEAPSPSARADAFIATLSRAQRDMLRRLLDEADRPRPGDEDEVSERAHGT